MTYNEKFEDAALPIIKEAENFIESCKFSCHLWDVDELWVSDIHLAYFFDGRDGAFLGINPNNDADQRWYNVQEIPAEKLVLLADLLASKKEDYDIKVLADSSTFLNKFYHEQES